MFFGEKSLLLLKMREELSEIAEIVKCSSKLNGDVSCVRPQTDRHDAREREAIENIILFYRFKGALNVKKKADKDDSGAKVESLHFGDSVKNREHALPSHKCTTHL